jgi:serine/threonine protein phosphatase 1
MKTLIIGDIQGCFAEFQDLLDKAGIAESDAIIALGDLVDRGPASPQVLDFFMTQPTAQSLMGNHERKHVRAFRGEIQPALSQQITRRQCGEDRYAAAVAYMTTLPHFLELPQAILVHAFFEPHVPLAAQRETVIIGTMGGEKYLQQRYDRPWYELYDGDKPIIVGHHDYQGTGEPFVYRDRVFGIDTGCCFGRALTGVLLPAFRLFSVPSRQDHWRAVKQEYAALQGTVALDETRSWDDAERAVDALFEHITQENARVLSQLRAEGAFDALPVQEQGRRYAARIGQTPLAPLLHRARKGALSRETLRLYFKSPGAVRTFVQPLGLWRPPGLEEP